MLLVINSIKLQLVPILRGQNPTEMPELSSTPSMLKAQVHMLAMHTSNGGDIRVSQAALCDGSRYTDLRCHWKKAAWAP